MTAARTLPIWLALLGASCIGSVKLGEQPPDDSSDVSDEGEDDGRSTTTDTGPVEGALGMPCAHGIPLDDIDTVRVSFPSPECQSQICVYADVSVAPDDACADDTLCNAANPGLSRFECTPQGRCNLAPEYILERSMCATTCEQDDDCLTDTATGCQTGFSCAAMSVLGEHTGCQPICVCNDDLDLYRSQTIASDCMDGTAPVCTEHPGVGLCPD